LAEPGEFTLRAFLGGRIDLTQAEAVLGVIDAGSRPELDVALRQMAGGLGGPLNQLRDDLLDLLAHLEAGLDFVEEDIEFIARDELLRQLETAEAYVAALTDQMASRGESSQAVRAVLLGGANVGKSSLFNALAERDGAIVSEIPGTTRDYLTARIDLAGVWCELVDTAGIDHAAQNPIAAAAQQATAGQNRAAEVRILCIDSSRDPSGQSISLLSDETPNTPTLVVLTKCDLPPAHGGIASDAIETSSQTGAGLDTLRAALRRLIADDVPSESQVVGVTAVRCRESLRRAATQLAAARAAVETSAGEEIVAAEIRTALDELGQVVGAVYTDDILDRIFSRFCIGK
jgi:tRNA modification GTPase